MELRYSLLSGGMNKLTVRKCHKPPHIKQRMNSIPRRGTSTCRLYRPNLTVYSRIQRFQISRFIIPHSAFRISKFQDFKFQISRFRIPHSTFRISRFQDFRFQDSAFLIHWIASFLAMTQSVHIPHSAFRISRFQHSAFQDSVSKTKLLKEIKKNRPFSSQSK